MNTVTILVENNSTPYLTATEAHALAISWENEELKGCLTSLTEQVRAISAKGGLAATLPVRGGRPDAFYDTLEKALKQLGYQVEPPLYLNSGTGTKNWVLRW